MNFFQHKDLRKSQAEVFVAMCKDHFKAELDVHIRHHEPIYDSLKLLLEVNHREHKKNLNTIHDIEVDELKKEMETKSKANMKDLAKKYKDKQELAR